MWVSRAGLNFENTGGVPRFSELTVHVHVCHVYYYKSYRIAVTFAVLSESA